VPEIAILGALDDPRTVALVREAHRGYLPDRIVEASPPGQDDATLPLLAGKSAVDGQPAAYVCRDSTCLPPVTEPEDLRRLLERD
jgi:uncharacterized protein YyaL (SSP411 family)